MKNFIPRTIEELKDWSLRKSNEINDAMWPMDELILQNIYNEESDYLKSLDQSMIEKAKLWVSEGFISLATTMKEAFTLATNGSEPELDPSLDGGEEEEGCEVWSKIELAKISDQFLDIRLAVHAFVENTNPILHVDIDNPPDNFLGKLTIRVLAAADPDEIYSVSPELTAKIPLKYLPRLGEELSIFVKPSV